MAREFRITPGFFHILLSLVSGPRHGWAIMQEIEARTDGTITLGPGSLYWSLGRLQDAGLIEEAANPHPEDPDAARRKYHRLTGAGRERLRAEARTLRAIVAHAEAEGLLGADGGEA